MGQIIGGAAKPKRCNLSKLSQLGTPAAGEYILVSSDNSMNAAGQGYFDSYIIGDGKTAATALELHKFKAEELDEQLNGIDDVLLEYQVPLVTSTKLDVTYPCQLEANKTYHFVIKNASTLLANHSIFYVYLRNLSDSDKTNFYIGGSATPVGSMEVRYNNNTDVYITTTAAVGYIRFYASANSMLDTVELPVSISWLSNNKGLLPTLATIDYVDEKVGTLQEDIDGTDNYTTGGWIGQDGLTITNNSDYAYSEYIDVTEGDAITVVKGISDINLWVSLYPIGSGQIASYQLSAASVSRAFTVSSGYNRIRFSFPKDYEAAKVLKGSAIIWERVHTEGITERLNDTVQTVAQEFSDAQKTQVKANIGLPPSIDEEPTDNSLNLVTSGGVKKAVDRTEAEVEIALSKIDGGSANLLSVQKSLSNQSVNANTAYFDLAVPSKKITIMSNLTDENAQQYMCYLFDENGNRENSVAASNGATLTISKNYKIASIVVNYTAGVKYTGTLTVIVNTFEEEGITNIQSSLLDWTGFDERVIVPEYYFENNYLDDKVETINNIYRNCASNADVFFFQTDEHWEMNTKKSPALTKYIADKVGISMLVDGGDSCHNISLYNTTAQNPALDDYTSLRKKCFDGRVYHTIGNHEYLVGYFSDSHLFDGIQFGNWHDRDWFSGYTEVVYGDSLKHYYYVDNRQKKIRYIFLSAYQQEEPTPLPSDNTKYWIKATNDYELAQQNWLRNTALEVADGWTIVVFTHRLSDIQPYIDANGNCYNVTRTLTQNAKEIAKILLQYNGNGEIACVICGHLHADAVAYINDDFVGLSGSEATGRVIPEIVVTCDTGGIPSSHSMIFHGNDPHRDENTITEQAFDVVIIDKNIKKISLVRIGGKAFNILEQDEQTGYYPLYGDLEIREVTYGND